MIRQTKKTIFKTLGLKNYLKLVQMSFFILYRSGMLKQSEIYKFHYFVKKLIHKGDVIIDIGANLGYYTKLFSEWTGKSGKVYAVEPIEIYNKVTASNTKSRKNIVFLPYALGLEEKEIELVTSLKNGAYHTGLTHVYEQERDGKIETQDFNFKASMKVASKLFADFERIDYMKCDIEGYEYNVLSDMKPIIEQHKPIVQVEVWGQNETDTLKLFDKMGYNAYKLKKSKLVTDNSVSGDYIFVHKDRSLPKNLLT